MNNNLREIATANAKHKLAVIIDRFGDENGQRLTQEYLNQLIEEEMRNLQFSEYTFSVFREKGKSATVLVASPMPI